MPTYYVCVYVRTKNSNLFYQHRIIPETMLHAHDDVFQRKHFVELFILPSTEQTRSSTEKKHTNIQTKPINIQHYRHVIKPREKALSAKREQTHTFTISQTYLYAITTETNFYGNLLLMLFIF
jgi:hypothetical protein